MPMKSGHADKPKRKNNIIKNVIKLEKTEEVKAAPSYNPDELIFALDIGTRTVIGIVGVQEKNKFKVLAAESLEHRNRAMLDGQIHDISEVSEIAKEVKEKLEKKLGTALKRVAIAAAGRVLKTSEAKVEWDFDQLREIDRELVNSIELEGIQQAQAKLDSELLKEDRAQFYCVGYSVTNYYLNGYVISSLLGHKGKKLGIEVLATFLPHLVVDSLYTVMNKIGLEVASLTLEPIAAINATIPRDLRLLNLALVDVGAGTSDIAITKNGSVIAYAMAPIAGDEITESIISHLLVDFNTAEKVKISLTQPGETITCTDILGRKNTVKKSEVIEALKTSVEQLAETIAQKILEYNQKPPNAVFLIGGGSQVPGLTHALAGFLKLPEDRVAVRDRNVVQNVIFKSKKLLGPEAVTPLGIAYTAQLQKGQDFLEVTFNERLIRLFNSKKLTVADALILIGFNPEKLIGRSGKSLNFQLNGVKKTVRGEFGKPAEIFINGNAASLDTILNNGDSIRLEEAENGKDAQTLAAGLITENGKLKVQFNGNAIEMESKLYINGKKAEKTDPVSEGDIVEIHNTVDLKELLELSEIKADQFDITVNGRSAALDYGLKNMDVVECRKKAPPVSEVKADRNKIAQMPEVNSVAEPEAPKGLAIPEVRTTKFQVNVNGKTVTVHGDKSSYIFVDIFSFIDFDLSRAQGSVKLKLNGKQAGFTDLLSNGDNIEIYWE